MTINKKLTDRILSKIHIKNKNFIVLMLTNPHHINLFGDIIEKLIRNKNKNITFIVDNRIDKNLFKKINKKTEFIFHHPAIEIDNYISSFQKIKEIIKKKPDALISMSSCQSYERILFDNTNCQKLLIGPHHGDLFHEQFDPQKIYDTKLKNKYLKLFNTIFKYVSFLGINFFILKIIFLILNILSFPKRKKIFNMFLKSTNLLKNYFSNYASSPFFDKEFWFLFFSCNFNRLILKETFCFDSSVQVGSKPTEFICYSKNEEVFYQSCFHKLNWKIKTHNIIDINDFIVLDKDYNYQIILCAPQIACNNIGRNKLYECIELLNKQYKITSMFNRPHPYSDAKTLHFYNNCFKELSKEKNIKLEKKLQNSSRQIYVTGPSSITSVIFDKGPIIVIKEFPIQYDRQTDYLHGTYAVEKKSFHQVK